MAPGMTILCRHGATGENAEGRFLSRANPPLSATGRAQCERLRDALRELRPQSCLVSPMRRCLETREIAAPAIPFDICGELREVDFGTWEGRTLDWLQLHEAGAVALRRRAPVTFRPPGGESFSDVAVRVAALVESICGRSRTLVVGHRGTLSVVERMLRGLPLDSREVAGLEPGEFRIID